MAQEQFGRCFDFVPDAASLLVSVKLVPGVTFFLIGEDTYTFKTAATYNGSTSVLDTIASWYTNSSLTGAGSWTQQSQAAADSITLSGGMGAVFIDDSDLPGGQVYVEVVPAGSGTVSALFGDLDAVRSPLNLPTRSGSAS
jgi:hypothetical protein